MQQEQIAKSVLLNLFWQHIIVKLSNVFKNDTEFYFVMIKQHPPGLIKKNLRDGDLNPDLARDKRPFWPLNYHGQISEVLYFYQSI